MGEQRFEVARRIPAKAADVFAVLRDPRGHVAIDSSGMLMAASGDPVTGVGDTFTVHMDRESLADRPMGLYDVTVIIRRYEQDREINWTVETDVIDPQVNHVFGYRLDETDDGATIATAYYDWSEINSIWTERGVEFPVIPEMCFRASLGILARTVAPGKPTEPGTAPTSTT